MFLKPKSTRTLPSSGQSNRFRCGHVIHLALMKHERLLLRLSAFCAGIELQRCNIWSCCCHLEEDKCWEVQQLKGSAIERWGTQLGPGDIFFLFMSCLKSALPIDFSAMWANIFFLLKPFMAGFSITTTQTKFTGILGIFQVLSSWYHKEYYINLAASLRKAILGPHNLVCHSLLYSLYKGLKVIIR